MGWSGIELPLAPRANDFEFRTQSDNLRRYPAGSRHKNAKTTPCKVEWAPARTHAGHALRPGGRTTTIAPGVTRFTRSMTSSLVIRMQPDEMAWPIYSGWLVPWMRYRVSLLPW